jgi:CRP-like cAMP-binding protein
MAVRNNVDLLRKVPLFAKVDTANLQVLVFSSKRVEIKAGQFLVRESKPLSAGFLMLEGKAEAIREDGGSEVVVAELGPGGFVCAKSMVAKLSPTLSVRATTAVTALRITHELFIRVCKEFPDTGAQIMSVLAKEVDVSLNELQRVKDLFDKAQPFSGI